MAPPCTGSSRGPPFRPVHSDDERQSPRWTPPREKITVIARRRQGWRPVPDDGSLPTGAEAACWLAGFISSAWEDLARPRPEAAVDLAVRCAAAREAAFDPGQAVLVHGDLHAREQVNPATQLRPLKFRLARNGPLDSRVGRPFSYPDYPVRAGCFPSFPEPEHAELGVWWYLDSRRGGATGQSDGATVIAAGSHRDASAREQEPVVMSSGSVLVYSGLLLHKADANSSAAPGWG